MTLLSSFFVQSILIHSLLGGLVLLSFLLNRSPHPRRDPIKVEIQEVVKPTQVKEEKPLTIRTAQENKPSPPESKKARPVFGINKNTLTDETNPGAVALKEGNTLAKEIDQTPFSFEDGDALPDPTEEFLITKMPRLKSELRIPYPIEARKNGIEGLVVLEILIDETGKVRTATLIEGLGHGLDEAALTAIYNFEFTPAYIDQQPVAVRIRYGYRFILN